MEHNGVVIGVEDNDLQQTPLAVGPDDEHPIDPGNSSQGGACGVEDAFVGDAVLAGAVGNLHPPAGYLVNMDPSR